MAPHSLDIDALNRATAAEAAGLILPFIERAPVLAAAVADRRPFADPTALADAIRAEILNLSTLGRVALFQGHPELAPPAPETMTRHSQTEQGRLGLTGLGPADRARLDDLNLRYRDKFGFPFIAALHRLPNLATLLDTFERRLAASHDEEMTRTCEEIASVSRARVLAACGMVLS